MHFCCASNFNNASWRSAPGENSYERYMSTSCCDKPNKVAWVCCGAGDVVRWRGGGNQMIDYVNDWRCVCSLQDVGVNQLSECKRGLGERWHR